MAILGVILNGNRGHPALAVAPAVPCLEYDITLVRTKETSKLWHVGSLEVSATGVSGQHAVRLA